MRSYATAQNTGGRGLQCDAAAVHTAPDGTRAYVVLDGIGTSETIRDRTRRTAARLATRGAYRGGARRAPYVPCTRRSRRTPTVRTPSQRRLHGRRGHACRLLPLPGGPQDDEYLPVGQP
ncbi:hypothetical protein ACWDE9_45395, partial [Streptomyces olivaceoviridis]